MSTMEARLNALGNGEVAGTIPATTLMSPGGGEGNVNDGVTLLADEEDVAVSLG